MRINCTSRFQEHIQKYSKNNSYSAILADVCEFLTEKEINELHLIGNIYTSPGSYSLNKYRIKNGVTNKGKSSSFRCIAACFPKEDKIILDTIYPKAGSEGSDNLRKEAYKEIVTNIQTGLRNNTLLELCIQTKQFQKSSTNKKAP